MEEASLAEKCSRAKFIDDQIRFSILVPTDMLEKFQFISRKGISPRCNTNTKVPKLSKADRLKFGLAKNDKRF